VLYVILAIFWLVGGVLVQVFWDTLQPMMGFTVDRWMMGAVFFILASYNFIRWRMTRALNMPGPQKVHTPAPAHKTGEYNPALDFSKPDANEPPKQEDRK
jgi:hypothetical protein